MADTGGKEVTVALLQERHSTLRAEHDRLAEEVRAMKEVLDHPETGVRRNVSALIDSFNSQTEILESLRAGQEALQKQHVEEELTERRKTNRVKRWTEILKGLGYIGGTASVVKFLEYIL